MFNLNLVPWAVSSSKIIIILGDEDDEVRHESHGNQNKNTVAAESATNNRNQFVNKVLQGFGSRQKETRSLKKKKKKTGRYWKQELGATQNPAQTSNTSINDETEITENTRTLFNREEEKTWNKST